MRLYLTFGFLCFQFYFSARSGKKSSEYRCPRWRSCDCPCLNKLSECDGVVELFRNEPHTPESHRTNKKKFLSVMQMAGIDRSLSTHATASAKHIRQASNRLTDVDQHIGPELKGSVERHVRKVREVLLSKQLNGIEMSGKSEVQILRELCQGKLLEDKVARHNRDPTAMHLQPHKALISSHQFGNGVIHWGVTTLSMLMNVARVINAGDITLMMDGTFSVCQKEVCVYGIRVGILGGSSAPIGYSVNQTESTNAIRATYRGLESAFFHTLVNCVPCEDSTCTFCQNLRDLLHLGRMKEFVDSDKWGRWPVPFLMSDDGGGFKAYVSEDHPAARRLKCWQHVGSKYLFWPNCCVLIQICRMTFRGVVMAEIAFDNRTHRLLFTGGQAEADFRRFYKYLQWAAGNTFLHLASVLWEVLVRLLEEMGQDDVLVWFVKTLTGEEGCWMLCHGGPGNVNHNCSAESSWRYVPYFFLPK